MSEAERQTPKQREGAYGMIPPGLFATIRDRFLALVNSRNARRLPRT
jgi:hypothetical protein